MSYPRTDHTTDGESSLESYISAELYEKRFEICHKPESFH